MGTEKTTSIEEISKKKKLSQMEQWKAVIDFIPFSLPLPEVLRIKTFIEEVFQKIPQAVQKNLELVRKEHAGELEKFQKLFTRFIWECQKKDSFFWQFFSIKVIRETQEHL